MSPTHADTSVIHEHLLAVLPGSQLARSTPLHGGASAALTALDVVDPSGVSCRLVWRQQGPQGPLSIPADLEARIVRAARAAGVPAPQIITWFVDEPVLGTGYLMEHLTGETLPRRILRELAGTAGSGRLSRSLAQALARIHATEAIEDLPALGVHAQIAVLDEMYRRVGWPVPVFELALRWLRERAIEPEQSVLIHGDFRIGNLMVDDDRLVAVLDWELAHLGDPLEDLGWLCAPAWRFGSEAEAGGLCSRAELHAAYAEASGRDVDAAAAHFWEVLATLKWGVICQLQSTRVTGSKDHDLERLLIGRRVAETELDLLQQMDEEH